MELILNLAWFILAFASYGLLARRFIRRGAEPARGSSRLQCIVALTCVLAILFPVISLTDDLYEMQATMEEASPSRLVIKKSGAQDASIPAKILNRHLFVVSSFTMCIGLDVLGRIPSMRIDRVAAGDHQFQQGRAPPFFTIS